MLEKIAKGLTRKPLLVLIVALALLVPSAIGFLATRVNYDILTYLPAEAESSQGIQLLEEPFHMAATSMLIIEDMPAAWSNDLLNEIKQIPGVSNTLWLSNIVGVQVPTDMIPAEFRDIFFSKEGSTMMIIQYEKAGASQETMDAIDAVRALLNDKCYLAGFSVVVKDTKELVDEELPIFVSLAVAFALAAMALCLESWVLPLVLISNIGIAILYNFGTNIVFGEISYITQAVAAVLQLGVTMDYSIFLYHRYIEERENHDDKRDAMAVAIVAAFKSLSGSSLTTVAGFLALCAMHFTLGKDIGLVLAKGVVLGVATVVLVLPAIVLLCDKWIEKTRHKPLLPEFDRINRFVVKARVPILIVTVLLVIPGWFGQNHVSKYYKLDTSLPDDLPSLVANHKLADEFGMTTQHFIVMRDDVSATDMNAMEQRIEDIPGISGVVSYHALLGQGIPDFFIPEQVKSMLKQGGYQMLMVNSEYETATDDISRQLTNLMAVVKEYDDAAMVTGESAMTEDLIDITEDDFVRTNYLSIAAIFLIVLFVFKSLTVPVVLVALIETAIMLNQGFSYFSGATIAFVIPTIVSTVQLGATVDYAILMASRFQEELQAGYDRKEAARIAGSTSDHSVITSALVMIGATMGVVLVCRIDIVNSMCLMLARGALVSAIVSIFVVPAALCVFEPLFNVTSLHWKPKRKQDEPPAAAEAVAAAH